MIKLSNLIEKKKKKRRNKRNIVKRFHGGYMYSPFWVGYNRDDIGGDSSVGDSGGEGGGDGGGMEENNDPTKDSSGYSYVFQSDYEVDGGKMDVLHDFVKDSINSLEIKTPIMVTLTNSRDGLKTLAHYDNNNLEAVVYCGDRHTADVARSIAHELVHKKQFEYDEIPVGGVQDIGGDVEDEANSRAGSIVKRYGYKNPKLYEY